ncbi:MAG TPA: MBL fold metallo-hydrolase [Syntrophorhabdaceae bacterium]|nr:MBL fold metallo-hydrolase [Syntrophorhabdaceae bacterium]
MGPKEIHKGIYLVGSSDITDPKDCCVYLLDLGELVLIDAGAGTSTSLIVHNIEKLGFDVSRLSTIILTHCHIDHVGGGGALQERSRAKIVMHELDALPVEQGDQRLTAAQWYGVRFKPLPVDLKFSGSKEVLSIGGHDVVLLHTPGHTPGSISVYLDKDGKRVLFGQDIHGPFLADFGANMTHWQTSMEQLIALNADILCEGHFGIYQPSKKVAAYIERYLEEYAEG